MLPDKPEDLATVQIGDIALTYRKRDSGGTHYLGRGHTEEYHSPLYPALKAAIDPAVCVDVGANYGYTGLLMRRAFPECHLTLVEPIPWLADFVAHNFAQNKVRYQWFHSAIVSASEGRSAFGVNQSGSQDSRVVGQKGTSKIETRMVTLSKLVQHVKPDQGVYIKIDTQGWEEHVFAGGAAFLDSHNCWFIKTEFAPMWMESQGSDPVGLLRDLLDRYSVYENIGRHAWNSRHLGDVLGRPLVPGCEEAFVHYVRNLALNDRGWVDLYVVPPETRRTYAIHAG